MRDAAASNSPRVAQPSDGQRRGNIRPGVRAAVGGLALLILGFAAGSAAALEPAEAVEAGRQALSTHSDYPWYDARQDSLRRIDVQTPRESALNRGSMWQAGPETSRDFSWLEALWRALGTGLRWLAWIGLAILLIALGVLLARAFVLREELIVPSEPAETLAAQSEADRIESLPFQIRMPQADLLAEAQRCYERGDYGQAVIYLFSYKLLALDRHNLIRLTRGKTNRQYVAELAHQPPLQEILQRTMVAFEDVFFGQHRLERERFEACWRRLDDFHQRIEQPAAT